VGEKTGPEVEKKNARGGEKVHMARLQLQGDGRKRVQTGGILGKARLTKAFKLKNKAAHFSKEGKEMDRKSHGTRNEDRNSRPGKLSFHKPEKGLA